jgi:D-sedoheptulose 7-phosphate isomerase
MHGSVKSAPKAPVSHFIDYQQRLSALLASHDWSSVAALADELLDCAQTGRQVFITGNGGSAGNAVHLANDFIYAWSKKQGRGIRIHALPANPAIMTCLGNDEGYDEVFAAQLAVLANPGDVLIIFSGSGNSKNILRVLEQAKKTGVRSYAVLGFDGGKAKAMCDVPIHFVTNDMQIAEDAQLILGHMIVQHLNAHRDLLERG